MGFDVDKDLYFVSKEISGVKKSLTGFSHSVTALKLDVEALKVVVSVVAVTAQILKVDYSLWKVDEKGITFRGVQKVTWRNVKEAESAKASEKEKKLDDRLKAMFLAKTEGEEIRKAREAARSAKESADDANRDIARLRSQLRSVGSGIDLGARSRKRDEFNKMRTSVQRLSQALGGI
ncbi:hypothetical protein B7C62_21900 [Kitasatospora albolonga]|uniref:Uncharacterized protein n=1 Tax=Kitasatospora albolonga TaxID=68173 RepID=A0ABC8BXY8_9ACTN|nr:hypothetical protein B7C62_21900 [Kitasatospora albolonga]